MNNIMMFNENEVEVIDIDGKALSNPYDVGKCLDIPKSTVKIIFQK